MVRDRLRNGFIFFSNEAISSERSSRENLFVWKKYDLVSQPVKSNINWLYNENSWWNFLKRWRIILYTSFLSILSCASELKGENTINVLYVKDCLCNKNILVCFCVSWICIIIHFFMIWIANDKFIFDFLRFDR
jgi:hypothetical protein